MLSIGKIAPGQHAYYEKQVARGRDDYYSGKGEAPGVWTGAAAAHLGLEGRRVTAEAFDAMIAGVDPSNPLHERQLNPRAGSTKVAAYDLTFSAPKSVSVLFATADAATSSVLIGAHEAAVGAALQYLEDEAVKVRRGKDGAVVHQGKGLLAAAYRHRMSRAQDPQLHTHVVCANLAEGPDGRWTGLWGSPLFQHAKTAGTLYQAHLRAEVRAHLGLEWGPVHKGAAELEAVGRPVLEAFSQRRQLMEALAAADGLSLDSKARAEASALGSRDRKADPIDDMIWKAEVRHRAAELGLDEHAIDELLIDGRLRLQVDGPASAPVDLVQVGEALTGPSGLTQIHNTFGTREALIEMASAHQQGMRVDAVRDAAGGLLVRDDVQPLPAATQTVSGEERFTTVDLMSVERTLIAAAVRREDTAVAAVGDLVVDRVLARAERPLNAGQAGAVRGVTTSGNGVDVIQALAGTGKTYTAGVLREVYETAGIRVIGAGPTGRAVRELTDEAGIPSWTVDALFLDFHEGSQEDLPAGSVVILDEAGMTSTRMAEWLVQHAARCDAKVIAIGDAGQLPSVNAGGWMTGIARRVGQYELVEVMRQRDFRERRVLAELHDGAPDGYVRWLDGKGRLSVHQEPVDALQQAVGDWAAATDAHGVQGAVLIARDNDTRDVLNTRARTVMQNRGRLGQGLVFGDVEVAVGDRVIARRNKRHLDVDNGTRGTVSAVHTDRIVVTTDAGTVRELPAAYVADHIEHAYALTGHGVQGATVEWAGVVAQPRDLTRGWSYTALSRARGETHAYVQAINPIETAERADLAPHDTPENRTRTTVLQEITARMTVRDDEDLAVDELGRATPAGAPNDPQLVRDAGTGDEPAEWGAERNDTNSPVPARARLVLAARERAQLTAMRAGLPTRDLDRLDHAHAQRARTAQQRAEMARRLETLPDPPTSTLLRRTPRDERAAERARLRSGIAAADEQLAAIDTQIDTLTRRVGDPDQVRHEAAGLSGRIAEVERDHGAALSELATLEIDQHPRWARDTLGDRPDDRDARNAWDTAVTSVVRASLTEDPEAIVDGLGTEPSDPADRQRWQQAREDLERAQQTLRRDVDGPARGLGL